MSQLASQALSLAYGENLIIDELDLVIPQGKISVLIGANGSGKSTLLKALARLLKPRAGAVLLDGEAINRLPTKAVARQLAILPQGPTPPEGVTVLQLVRQGRFPYQGPLKQWSEADEAAVREALRATGTEALAERSLDSLSGGQRQRAWIAMTLAQGTEIILLDEPTTYLDLSHQIEVLDLLYELNRKENRTIVMVLHDLNLAARYADHLIAVHNKKVYAQGPPAEVLTATMLREVFQIRCKVVDDPLFGTPMCVPYGRLFQNFSSGQ